MRRVPMSVRWLGCCRQECSAACSGPLGRQELSYRCTHPANVIGIQLKTLQRSWDGVRLKDRVLIMSWTSRAERMGWMSVRKEQGRGQGGKMAERTRVRVVCRFWGTSDFPRQKARTAQGRTARLPPILSLSCLHDAMVNLATRWLAEPSTDREVQDKVFFFPPNV